MAKRSTRARTTTTRPNARRGGPDGTRRRFARISSVSSQIVQDAAALLDEELAVGIVTARKVQQRLENERRIDPADFKDAVQRFQSDAHHVVSLLNEQFAELRSQESADLVNRFVANAHDLLDVVVGLLNTGGEIANDLLRANRRKPRAPRRGTRSR